MEVKKIISNIGQLILGVVLVCAFSIIQKDGFIYDIYKDYFVYTKKIGDAEAVFNGNEILVKNFPHYTQGISGVNEISFGDFSFDELDKFIYEIVNNSSLNEIYIAIQYADEDIYGHKTDGEKITIGRADVRESKKYIDFEHWNQVNNTSDMFWKDKREYDELIARSTNNSSFSIIPAYVPRDIKNITPWVIGDFSNVVATDISDDCDNISKEEASNDSGNKDSINEKERIAGELRWTNPVYLKARMDEIVLQILGQENIETGAQFNFVCQESEEFYKLINRYMELTGENAYN
ncbi:hypothetical protein [Bacteroides ihuae]|uniref:hypothetical protein n=1 Tax=Bacteroides ihuae TaxID=1852362 RepID=UPI0008DA97D5|nr:hypothetical protein [Bacteroides ihuae]